MIILWGRCRQRRWCLIVIKRWRIEGRVTHQVYRALYGLRSSRLCLRADVSSRRRWKWRYFGTQWRRLNRWNGPSARCRRRVCSQNGSIWASASGLLSVHGLIKTRILWQAGIGLSGTAVEHRKRRINADLKMTPALASWILRIEARYSHDDLVALVSESNRQTEQILTHFNPMIDINISPTAVRVQA